jgi:UDP-glucose 4-epimerase
LNILLTGGAGYLGSHAAVALSEAGHEVVIFDDFSNSDQSVLTCIGEILGRKTINIRGDVRNTALISKVLCEYKIDSVIHFAGVKSVHESFENPLKYYSVNIQTTISLLQAMQANDVRRIVFSSSATVYGVPVYLPYDENHPTNPINSYGRTKLYIESMLSDLSLSDPNWAIAILRYFNPVGAHDSGLIGERPLGVPNNLMPYLAQVLSGKLPRLQIFGNDYETPDGTGERDYIHVMDLVEGHLSALNFLTTTGGCHTFNLGSGKPTSVLELVRAFEDVTKKRVPYEFSPRREGDLPSYYASASKAQNILGWESKRSIEQMCKSSWASQLHSMRR